MRSLRCPSEKDTDDLYHYGVRQAVEANGLLPLRVDKDHFAGEIFAHIKSKIDRATLLIADLTGANANVYLELGYAWGKGRPTILLTRDVNALKFDVRGVRCLVYDSIYQLETMLTEEIRNMKTAGILPL